MLTQSSTNLEVDLAEAERELERCRDKVAALRRSSAAGEIRDYDFTSLDGKKERLSGLFGNKDDLIVIHNMGKSCPYCTMWADGFNGVLHHIEDRSAVAVISPDAYDKAREFATGRGWQFRMLSADGTTFFKDMGFESENGKAMPGVSTFHREKDGRITRVSKAGFGPGDEFCSTWHLFDMLKDGANGWEPKFSY